MKRIEDYALIGDLHTAALVNRTGAIEWLCLPRFDSPAVFASMLDTDDAGHWTVAPTAAGSTSTRCYTDRTLVLETRWDTVTGRAYTLDFMPPRQETPHIIRIVCGETGAVNMRSTLSLRFDYGRVTPWVKHHGNRVDAIAGPDCVRLMTDVPMHGKDWQTIADFSVRPGDRIAFVMSWAPSHAHDMALITPEDALAGTVNYWTDWVDHATQLGTAYGEAVERSLITLKALTYEPTGGIIAAPTTSLPEDPGGVRNWDYRYCWLRDATYTLQALLAVGCTSEAAAWRDWLMRTIAGRPDELQIMYSVDGARRLPEQELPWLTGFQSSAPVRIGNAASDQLQLDVWGETLDALFLGREGGLPPDPDAWSVQVALMAHLETAWREPDNGLWEVRGPRQHFTHSKVMCWVAADRMARSVQTHGLPGPADRWAHLREEIKDDILTHGYDHKRNTFTQSYRSAALDASLLLIPRVGFLPPDDPRVLGTIDAIQRELTVDGLVLRYQTDETDDGVKGNEGLFIACSFWLVDALHAAGRRAEAINLFERLLRIRNDVGLLSEEWDPIGHQQLGNTPQAFSHFGLVVSALQLRGTTSHRSDQRP